jgi:ribosomal protein S18 acetylase RimI-like enzyme
VTDDVKRALPAMVRAFWDFPETLHLLPSERKRKHALPRFLGSDMRDAHTQGGLRLAERDGKVVGALGFLPPGTYPPSWQRQLRQIVDLAPALPWGFHAAREGMRGSQQNAAQHRVHDEPHYFIQVLGVDPDYQRKGVGTELIKPVLQEADAMGVGSFLFTATEANAAWYGSLGFETTKRYNPTPTWPDVWAMWRPAV